MAQPTASATSNDVSKFDLVGVRVLLVDDSSDNQRLFERVLASAGAQVDVAENGVVAIARSMSTSYNVIIMDIRMPMMDGYEATRRIRSSGYRGPILALTAHANPGEEERCREAGCSGFYLKPINRAGLLTAVSDAVKPVASNSSAG
ncbi:MAG: response regulator [Proteobacteria bacterium]|nr:MAG: response regulator [Pseudomonadota bacterium]